MAKNWVAMDEGSFNANSQKANPFKYSQIISSSVFFPRHPIHLLFSSSILKDFAFIHPEAN